MASGERGGGEREREREEDMKSMSGDEIETASCT